MSRRAATSRSPSLSDDGPGLGPTRGRGRHQASDTSTLASESRVATSNPHHLCRSALLAAIVGVVLLLTAIAPPHQVSSQAIPSLATADLVELELLGHTGGAVRAAVVSDGDGWMGEGIGITAVDVEGTVTDRLHVMIGLDADVHSLAGYRDILLVGGRDGAHVLKRSSQGQLEKTYHLRTPGTVRALTVWEPTTGRPVVFVSDDRLGVLVAVLEDDSLRVTSGVNLGSGSWAPVAVTSAGLALVPGDNLVLVSVVDPEHPVAIGALSTSAPVRGAVVSAGNEHLAYVSVADGKLLAVDLSTPTYPKTIAVVADAPSGALHRLGAALLLIDDGIFVVDIDPEDPTKLTVLSSYDRFGGTISIAIDQDKMLAARRDVLTLAQVDPNIPRRQPQIIEETDSISPIRQLQYVDDYVYVARGDKGLDVVSVSDPEHVEPVLGYRPPWGVHGVISRGALAFVSTERGMECWSIDDPGAPVPGACAPLDWDASRWTDLDDELLVATTLEVLHVATLDQNGYPTDAGQMVYGDYPSWPLGTVPQGVALGPGSVAYVAGGPTGIMIIDISDRQQPELHSIVEVSGGAMVLGVAVSSGYLAVGTDRGLEFYDLALPMSPQLVGPPLSGFSVRAMDFQHPRLYVAADMAGLIVIDTSDPQAPIEAGRLSAKYPIYDVKAESRQVYAAGAGLLVLAEKSRPVDPTIPAPSPSPPPVVPSATPRPSPTSTPVATPTPKYSRIYQPVVWIWRE